MTDLPTVAVIVPAYNAEAFLERAVASVFATDYPALDVIIVDDGSRDATVPLAMQLCDRWPNHCRLLRHPDGGNHGVSASRNLGIRASSAEWVAFLDADDFYLPNRFDALARMHADPECEGIYEICEIRGEAQGRAPSDTNAAPTGFFGIAEDLSGSPLLAALLMGRCWATSAITLRRSVLDRTGLFDPGKRIAEDCDLWFRAASIARISAGQLVTPVSVYWRHAANTYQYQPSHRVDLLQAMLDAWRWARHASVDDDVRRTYRTQVYAYATRSLIAARERCDSGVVRQILVRMAGDGRWAYFLRRATLRQVAHFALGRESKPTGSAGRSS
jgi:glycosyltransferase involved in cell wall biosynthesis